MCVCVCVCVCVFIDMIGLNAHIYLSIYLSI